MHHPIFLFVLLLLCSSQSTLQVPDSLTPAFNKPFLGWDTWCRYGWIINETQIMDNAQVMAADYVPVGYRWIVLDISWYRNPNSGPMNGPHSQNKYCNRFGNFSSDLNVDEYGRFVPSPTKFPSSKQGNSFKPLVDKLHAMGIKLALHIIRGIPKPAVDRNLPVHGSTLRAAEIANKSSECQFCHDNYDIKTKDGMKFMKAYYKSVVEQFQSWGVDGIKMDCVFGTTASLDWNIYGQTDIQAMREVIKESKNPNMALILSQGGNANVKRARELIFKDKVDGITFRNAPDYWDYWQGQNSLVLRFAVVADYVGISGPGHWQCNDMLPLGTVGGNYTDHPPLRKTRLTHTEALTTLSLWSIVKSPIQPCDLLDEWTKEKLTNLDMIFIQQESSNPKPLRKAWGPTIPTKAPKQFPATVPIYHAWIADLPQPGGKALAMFNLGEKREQMSVSFASMGLKGEVNIYNIWENKAQVTPAQGNFTVEVEPHGSALLTLFPAQPV